jgi:hypothetical protein
MESVGAVAQIRDKFEALAPLFNERTRRCWAAAEAKALGHGGVSTVARATALARQTITTGIQELATLPSAPAEELNRIRQQGAGRRPLTEHDPALLTALDRLIDPMTRGAPDSPLRWTCKGTARLAAELVREGHHVSARTVAAVLEAQHYSLQSPVKRFEGASSKDRNAQFEYIAAKVSSFQAEGWPAISVDSKKKELIGNFSTSGREWQPSRQPVETEAYTFQRLADELATPYGAYDLSANEAWVTVGTSHDTPRFAVQSVRTWWQRMGRQRYRGVDHLLLTADGGGSNSVRARMWKAELQALADETGLNIAVCHFPPGTSKWNKIEHRLFCHITENWRGRPLISLETIVQLIGHTTTKAGLRVRASLDPRDYPVGEKVTKADFAALNLVRDSFHGEWNYWLKPRSKTR